jgi:lysophospholipase L1-like esterase
MAYGAFMDAAGMDENVGRTASLSATDSPALPRSMAAIGDSITQGFGADPLGLGVATHLSWATGDNPGDPVHSHYERLLEAGADIKDRAVNLAVAGTRMADAPRQARAAVAAEADYVTLLMGANDVCVWSKAWMTPIARFEARFRETLEILIGGLPNARIFVLSIPDLYQIWTLLHDHSTAKSTWGYVRPCRSMFAKLSSNKDRLKVRDRNIAFNETLERVSSEYGCHFDEHAVFERAYIADHLGSDFFHPSVAGQRSLAEVGWRSGPWPRLGAEV